MPFSLVGVSNNIAEVDPGFQAARMTLRPDQTRNYQSTTAISGGMTTVTAGTAVWSMRYNGPRLLLVRRLSVSLTTTVGFTAAIRLQLGLFRAFNWITSDTGGTAIGTIPQNQHRSSMTRVAVPPEIRIAAAAAAGVTAGTRTLETVALAQVQGYSPAATAGSVIPLHQFIVQDSGDYPMVLQASEGLVLTYGVTGTAGGTTVLTAAVEWAEADSY